MSYEALIKQVDDLVAKTKLEMTPKNGLTPKQAELLAAIIHRASIVTTIASHALINGAPPESFVFRDLGYNALFASRLAQELSEKPIGFEQTDYDYYKSENLKCQNDRT